MNAIKNKMEVVFFISCEMSNYNGDPDFADAPRTIFQNGHGFMTDVSIKRRIRDYIQDAMAGTPGYDIFVRNAVNINRQIAGCVIEASGDEPVIKGKKAVEAAEIAKKKFFDVRCFGAVMTTGINAGQVNGAVQIRIPQSYDPVQIENVAITRLAYTEKDFTTLEAYDEYDKTIDDDKKRTMGEKPVCVYALFPCHVFVSANLAQKNGFSEKDFNLLLESIMNMYSYQTSASKSGMSIVGPVIVFKHVGRSDDNNVEQKEREALLGCVPTQRLLRLIDVHKKDGVETPISHTDYDATINVSALPSGVEVGFKYGAFEDIQWGHTDATADDWMKEI